MDPYLQKALTEQALRVSAALGNLQNAWWQNDNDTEPCDIRLHRALGCLLEARAYLRTLRANHVEDRSEYEWIEEIIETAVDECSHQYSLR